MKNKSSTAAGTPCTRDGVLKAVKSRGMKQQRTYSIYDLKHGGQLLAALPWSDVRAIYKSSDDRLMAVYPNRKGSPCVRWILTGLEATTEESVEALWKLKTIRGDKPLNLPTVRL